MGRGTIQTPCRFHSPIHVIAKLCSLWRFALPESPLPPLPSATLSVAGRFFFFFLTITFVRSRFLTPTQTASTARVSDRDRRLCDFVGALARTVIRFDNRSPASIVRITRVGFAALFRAELRPRKYASLRIFNAVAARSSSRRPSSPRDLHR